MEQLQWSVSLAAEGDREVTLEEVVELADAVAPLHGVASGAGSTRYGAQILVEAASRDEAIGTATERFTRAAATAGLPPWPVVQADAFTEDDELRELG